MARNGKHAGLRPAKGEPSVSSARNDVVAQSAGAPVEASFKPDGKGGGTLHLRYSGPLIEHPTVWVRVGDQRRGTHWLETRDVKMDLSHGQASARIPFGPGDPLEGASFAFFALRDGQVDPSWDNAGRPFGCYWFDPVTGIIESR
ncbi:MAG: hypothetical protein HY901_01250 [Deltaproteobacteria bacterium]|nr:hypothetical protein [Deltaproteobacteria bacterium]